VTVEHLEFLVEEQSMEAALRVLLPKIVGDLSFEVYRHQGKSELLKALPDRLRGYASWIPSNWRIVVVVDRDDDECKMLKARLEKIALDAGLVTRSTAGGKLYAVINRVAIEELEAWYFGDWQAVVTAYPRVPLNIPDKAAYRDPDAIAGGTWEALERTLQRAGYFGGGLPKIEAARNIAALMDPTKNRSRSFCAFRDALGELATA
jgi:hypothetical protein